MVPLPDHHKSVRIGALDLGRILALFIQDGRIGKSISRFACNL